MSWQDQGRQYHMWFGSGHAPVKLKPIVETDGSTTEHDLGERLRTVVHGAIGALPRKLRQQVASQFQAGMLETLTEAMAAWIYGSKMDAGSFAHYFFDRAADDAVVASLRAAASETVKATTRQQLAAASGHLADAIKRVRVDNWPRFVADVRRRAHDKATLAAIEKSQRPVISVSATVGASGSGNAGGGTRLAQGMVEEPPVRVEEPPVPVESIRAPSSPAVSAPPAPGAMSETETPDAAKPAAPPAEALAAKPVAETAPYIKLPSHLEPGFDTSKPIGHFTVPAGLTPGTTLFGDYVHEEIVKLIRAAAPGVDFTANTESGINGVDHRSPYRRHPKDRIRIRRN